MSPTPDRPKDDPEFEELIAALLEVEPGGITGQSAGKSTKKPKPKDDPKPE